MKIAKLETFFVKPRWLFLKMTTNTGLVGWGEPIVEGRARTVATAIKEMEGYLIGKDPRMIETHWQAMYRGTYYRGGAVLTSALSGIEQAMWDIKGKHHGVPVYELLGGPCRQRIRMYAGCHGNSLDQLEQRARHRLKQGFTAIKTVLPTPVKDVEKPSFVKEQASHFSTIREVVGPEFDIAMDFHGRVGPAMAIRLAEALAPYHPMFIEEPCLPENVDVMVRIARGTTIPIATGERLFTRWGFREVIEKQAAAILQPDVCHAGGISEVKKIAAMAEVYYASVAPHNPLGPISLASCLQVDAAVPNFLIQEHPGMDEGWDLGQGYLKVPFQIRDGYIDLPQGPGLGIEVDERVVAERANEGNWDTPIVYHRDDGSFAEW